MAGGACFRKPMGHGRRSAALWGCSRPLRGDGGSMEPGPPFLPSGPFHLLTVIRSFSLIPATGCRLVVIWAVCFRACPSEGPGLLISPLCFVPSVQVATILATQSGPDTDGEAISTAHSQAFTRHWGRCVEGPGMVSPEAGAVSRGAIQGFRGARGRPTPGQRANPLSGREQTSLQNIAKMMNFLLLSHCV